MVTLDARKAAVLSAIVSGYIHTGEPVGSKRIVEDTGLAVSAATVRSEMVALEELGYIRQPHTSAGRVPTDRGYRFFVDSLQHPAPLLHEQRAAVEGLLAGSADVEELLRRATGVLSRLTHYAALVVAPRLDSTRVRHIELVQLGPKAVLAVLIGDNGRVDKRVIDLDQPIADHDVERARYAINASVQGLRMASAPGVLSGLAEAEGVPAELQGLLVAVSAALRAGLSGGHASSEQVFVGGTANIAEARYFTRLEDIRQVYETLEEQVLMLRLLHETLEADDPAVRIGAELMPVDLAYCSLVAASYGTGEEGLGSVGVLGPSRMDYSHSLAAVKAVASSLETALDELTAGAS